MTNINISLTEEAYNYLKMLKGGDKSFSEVVIDMKKKESKNEGTRGLLKFFGALKDKNIDWKERENKMTEFRDSFNKRLTATSKIMAEHRK